MGGEVWARAEKPLQSIQKIITVFFILLLFYSLQGGDGGVPPEPDLNPILAKV